MTLRFFDWFLGLFGYHRMEKPAALPMPVTQIPETAVLFIPEEPSPEEVADLIHAVAQDHEMLEWYDTEGWHLLKNPHRFDLDRDRKLPIIETEDGKQWEAVPRWRETDWVYLEAGGDAPARPRPQLKADATPRAVEMRCWRPGGSQLTPAFLSRSVFIATYGFDPMGRYHERVRKQRAGLEAKRFYQEVLESGDIKRMKAHARKLEMKLRSLRRQ